MQILKKISLLCLFSLAGTQGMAMETEAAGACAVPTTVAVQAIPDENMDTVFDAAMRERIEKDMNKISTRCCMGISSVAGWASTLLLGSSVVLWGAQKITPLVTTVSSDSFLTRSAGYPLKIFGAALVCGLVSYLFDKSYLKAQIRACEIHQNLKDIGLSLDQKRVVIAGIISELMKRYHESTMKFFAGEEGKKEKEGLKLNIHACLILRAQFN